MKQEPFECRNEWAEEALATEMGGKQQWAPRPRLSLSALRDPSLSDEERMRIQDQLERQAARSKQKLLSNIEKAMQSYDRQPQDAAPSLLLSAFNAARHNIEIGDTGATLEVAKKFTKGVVSARDKMVRVWSHIWQNVDLYDIAQPEVLAYIISPVLLYGSPHAAGSLLKSLPKLHHKLEATTLPRQGLVRPQEIEYIVRSFAEDSLVDDIEQRLARHAWGEIATQRRQPANETRPYELPKSAERLMQIIIDKTPKKTKLRHTRRGVFTPL